MIIVGGGFYCTVLSVLYCTIPGTSTVLVVTVCTGCTGTNEYELYEYSTDESLDMDYS
jgi:hypothetical protein